MMDMQIADASALFSRTSPTGERDLVLVFDVVVYLENLEEHWSDIVAFYRRCLSHVGQDVRFYVVDGRAKFRPVAGDTFELLPFWAGADAGRRSIYGLTLHAGPNADDAPDEMFDFYADGADPPYLRLVMPVSFADRPTVVEDVIALVSDLSFLSGTAGYAVSKRRDYYAAKEGGPVFALSRRFRAVDFGSPLYFAEYVRNGLKSVNWMTFLGEELAERCGGVDALARAKVQGVVAHRLEHGIALQAGERPILGDVNRNESTELYRAVNKLVVASRFPVDTLEGYDGIGGEDNTKEWLTRFDDDSDEPA